MTRSEANRSVGRLTKAQRQDLNRRWRGWAFQMPPGDHAWWSESVDAEAASGFSRAQAEGYLREIAELVKYGSVAG